MGDPRTGHKLPEPSSGRALCRTLVALFLFAIAFAYVEAAVVVYLRVTYEPLHQRLYPELSATNLFPILSQEQLAEAGPEYTGRLYIELARETATLVMLAAVALVVARSARLWFGAFMVVFGIWDIFFYVFLRMLIGWPTSLFEWDLLFLLPLPWVGPVLAPVLVAASMIPAGVLILWRESVGKPVRMTVGHWTTILVGGLFVVIAFCWDYRNIMASGVPNPFHWPLFAVGEFLGITAFLHALWSNAPANLQFSNRYCKPEAEGIAQGR